jgi:hypothetical protein
MWRSLFAGQIDWRLVLTALCSTLLLSWLMARWATRLTATGFRALAGDILTPGSAVVRGPLRVVFDLAGLHPLIGSDGQKTGVWLLGPGLRAVLTALVAYTLSRATDLLVRRFEHEMSRATRSAPPRARCPPGSPTSAWTTR